MPESSGQGPEECQVCLGLGSNIAPEQNLPQAIARLRRYVNIQSVSQAWETPAIGSPGPNFLNAALLARTRLSLIQLKREIREIEASQGRVRTADKNAPRTIDIDIILVDEQLLEPALWTQAHIAVPVAELLPGYANKETGETLESAAWRLARQTAIHPRPGILHQL